MSTPAETPRPLIALVDAVDKALHPDAIRTELRALFGDDTDWVDLTVSEFLRAAIVDSVVKRVTPLLTPAPSSEDTPADTQQWAVRHPDVSLSIHRSPHSVLYTASKLPGGVIVTRASDQDEWRDETDCLCGDSKPADRHYEACPGVVPARVWQAATDVPRYLETALRSADGTTYSRQFVTNELWVQTLPDGTNGGRFSLADLPVDAWPLAEVPAGGEPA